jgi:hypothetical protein
MEVGIAVAFDLFEMTQPARPVHHEIHDHATMNAAEHQSGQLIEGASSMPLPKALTGPTLYARYGNWTLLAMLIATVGLAALANCA